MVPGVHKGMTCGLESYPALLRQRKGYCNKEHLIKGTWRISENLPSEVWLENIYRFIVYVFWFSF